MLNKAILQGRLVADPELRRTQSGVPVVSFRIACDRNYKSKDQNAQTADFINIVAWRQTAEFISRYFSKGTMILIEGSIQVRDYTDRDNNRRTITEVVAENVNFCGSKRESGGNGYNNAANSGFGGGYPAQGGGYPAQGGGYNAQNSGFGGYNNAQNAAPSYAAPAAYAPSSMGQAPANEFAELSDDDGELPF